MGLKHLLLLALIQSSRSVGDCDYNCKDRGGCTVMWRGPNRAGYTLGYCASDGRCMAAPPECKKCSDYCSGHYKNSQPILPVLEPVIAEEDYDYDYDNLAGPPAPPTIDVLPPAPPTPSTTPRPTPPPRPSTQRPTPPPRPSTTRRPVGP